MRCVKDLVGANVCQQRECALGLAGFFRDHDFGWDTAAARTLQESPSEVTRILNPTNDVQMDHSRCFVICSASGVQLPLLEIKRVLLEAAANVLRLENEPAKMSLVVSELLSKRKENIPPPIIFPDLYENNYPPVIV